MKNTTHTAGAFPSTLRFRLQAYLLTGAAIVTLLLTSASSSFAGSATWLASPASGDWNAAINWTAGGPPNGWADGSAPTATFNTSNITSLFLNQATSVGGIVFNPGASAFTINTNGNGVGPSLDITGAGITNNSGIIQNFVNAGADIDFNNGGIVFLGSATAGCQTAYTNEPDFRIEFADNTTAGSATITSNGYNSGGNGHGGTVHFYGSATAANATVTSNDGGAILFGGASTAENSTLIANGGVNHSSSISLTQDSTGGQARVVLSTNTRVGLLNIYLHNAPGVSIGSIEGDGRVVLGAKNLSVGSNNVSTIFSGLMQGSGGSLTKTGTGKLTLTKANTYTGGTTVDGGTLHLKNKGGSATGSGAVQVSTGTLRGTGIIAGAVTVGNGSSSGAILVGGESGTAPGSLTINNPLTFNSLATYKTVLKRSTPKASKVTALGVTINSTAQFVFVDPGTGALSAGTIFTVINNSSASPISGRFSNLAQGLIFTSKGTSFKVSYTGGTGNDLTLTVQ